jgi:hypothetical protein
MFRLFRPGGGPSTRLAAMESKKLDATVLDSPQTVQQTSLSGNPWAVLRDPHLNNALRCSRIGQSIKPRTVIVQDLSFGIVG